MTNQDVAAARTILAQVIVLNNQAAASAAAAAAVLAQVSYLAPLNSPLFTGTPRAPTPAASSNNTYIATTAYLDRLIGAAGGLAPLDNTGKIPSSFIPPLTVTSVSVVASQAAMLALSVGVGAFAIRTDLSNAVFVLSALPPSTLANWYEIGTSPVLSVCGLTGAISASALTAQLLSFAGDTGTGGVSGDVPAPGAGDAAAHKYLWAGGGWQQPSVSDLSDTKTGTGNLVLAASPMLTGTPVAPTAAVDTNTGQIASTAFVLAQAGAAAPLMDGTVTVGTSTRYARQDHVHPSDTSRLAVASNLSDVASAATAFSNLGGGPVGLLSLVTETYISLSDVTTENVSTARHGFAPKAPNDATKYLDGTGAYSKPPTTPKTKAILVTVTGGPGHQSVTGVGFTPSSLRSTWVGPALGSFGSAVSSGYADSTGAGTSVGSSCTNDGSSSGMQWSSATPFAIGQNGSITGTIVSYDADGFTVNWSGSGANGTEIAVLCEG